MISRPRHLILGTTLLLAALAPRPAAAQTRELPTTLAYGTVGRGRLQLDATYRWSAPVTDFSGPIVGATYLSNWLGVTYGLTDRWDLTLENRFEGGVLDGWRVATRYRFADPGRWPVDVMVSLEATLGAVVFGGSGTDWVRARLVLEKDLGQVSLVANVAAFVPEDIENGPWNNPPVPQAGVGVIVRPTRGLSLGLGAWATPSPTALWPYFVTPRLLVYLGPSVAVTHGRVWAQLAYTLGFDRGPGGAGTVRLHTFRIRLAAGISL